jgi:hypothetical protein
MPTFEILARGSREETITLDMPDVWMVIEAIGTFWTDEIFQSEGGSPFTLATVKTDGRTVAYGWLERAGWMWDDIED